jgi:uncharacterized protein YndB with AHSA1/START domain/ketosteroid isomerase-like protein
MASIKNAETNAADELRIAYVLDAPRELVYRNWLEPDLLQAWWAPEGFEVTRCEIDARAGGRWRIEYRAPSGETHSEYGELLELGPPERLLFTLTQADAHGHVGPQTTVQVQLQAQGNKTIVLFAQHGLGTSRRRDLNGQGWRECFGKLERTLASNAEDAAAESEIRDLFAAWWRDTSARDIERTMLPIAADVLSYEHEAPLEYRGASAVRQVCQRGFDAARGQLRWDVPDLHVVVRGDLAATWGLNHVVSREEGKAPSESWSRGTRIFRKLEGRWQMVHQHVSFPFDPESGRARFELEPGR